MWFIITEYLGFILVVISLVLAQSILLGLTGIVAYLYYLVKTDQAPFLTGIGVLDATIGNELYLLIFTILFSVLAFGLLVGILWYRKSLRMAGLVIQETGKATRNLKSIPIVGLIQSVLCAALLFGLMLVICLCFTVQSVNLPNENISRPLIISYISLWGIWTISIIYLIGRVAVSGAIYKWYWRKMSPEKNYLSPSFKAVFKENFGTIAFGTIAIPLVFIAGLINYAISPSYAKSVRKEDYRLKDNKFDKIGNRVNFLLDSVSQKAWVEVGRSNADFCRSAKVAHSKFHFPTR